MNPHFSKGAGGLVVLRGPPGGKSAEKLQGHGFVENSRIGGLQRGGVASTLRRGTSAPSTGIRDRHRQATITRVWQATAG